MKLQSSQRKGSKIRWPLAISHRSLVFISPKRFGNILADLKDIEDVGDLTAKQVEQKEKAKQLEQSESDIGKLKRSLVAHGLSDEAECMMTSKCRISEQRNRTY